MRQYSLMAKYSMPSGEKIPIIKALREAFDPKLELREAKEIADQFYAGEASVQFETDSRCLGFSGLKVYGIEQIEAQDPLFVDLANRIASFALAGDFEKAQRLAGCARELKSLLT